MSREEEYFEPGNLHGEDVEKFKKKDDKTYEYYEAKDENNCVVGYAYVLKSAKGSFRLEKKESCSNAKAIKKEELLVKDELPKQDESSSSESEEETDERDLIKLYKKYKASKFSNYQCPYCDWRHRSKYLQRSHVLYNHFSEDIYTALLTMLECTGGPCSLCGESIPISIEGWNKEKKEDRRRRKFTYRGGQSLLSHFADKHELTLTKGLVFSDNKLNQKNVDLLLDMLFPS